MLKRLTILIPILLPLFAQSPGTPVTGRPVPELAVYEAAVQGVMQKWAIPGASVAITDQGRLVFARGFGFADRENAIPVQPASIFRLASISKTLTGMTTLKLIEEGKFTLDDKMVDLLPNLAPTPGATMDPRVRQITVRQLLQHTAGWAREIPDDAALQFTAAARALNIDRAAITSEQVCRYVISQRLDFDPGARYYYSQAGYLLLGRIIERVTGKKYEDAVREKILLPVGATSLKVGRSLLSQKEPDEVRYYSFPGAGLLTGSPNVPGAVSPYERPYGAFWVEQAEAYGGWIGNTVDLMRYINALEGRRGPALLNPATLASIPQRPSVTPTGEYAGLTWRITPIAGGQHWWHSGSANGSRNLLTRRQNNRNWVVLMNMRPQDEDTIITDLFRAFADAESKVTSWPTHDLFSDFAGPQLSTSLQELSFQYQQDNRDLPPAQTLRVTSSPAAVNFTIAPPEAKWLKIDRLSGTTPESILVSVDPAGLQPGEYTGQFTVTAPHSANGTRTIRVSFNILPPFVLTGIRSSASLEPVGEAAVFSRITLESPVDLVQPFVSVGGVEAPIVAWSGKQVDLIVPEGSPAGETGILLLPASGATPIRGTIRVVETAPALFVPALAGPRPAVIRSTEGAAPEEIFECTSEGCKPLPIGIGPEEETITLRIPATGIRSQTQTEAYTVTIGDTPAPVTAVEASPDILGLDWVTVTIPRSLEGRGDAGVVLVVAEKASNSITINIK